MESVTIPSVAALIWTEQYPLGMKGWADRFRAHMKLHGLSQEALAAEMGLVQGTIGHWLRGRNKINLVDFWSLCEAAGADPKGILFGAENPALAAEIKQVLAAHPELLPTYKPFENSLRRSKTKRKARRKTPA